jgi:hypothetical protein
LLARHAPGSANIFTRYDLPVSTLRLPAEISAAIDAWAAAAGTSRSEAIRQWIDAGLKRQPKAKLRG